MAAKSNTTQIIKDIVEQATIKKIAHLHTEGKLIVNNLIRLNGFDVVNFSSCSYLGLEHDKRLQQGAINAIKNFGTQFSASRAYVSLGLYEELENLLGQIFDGNKVVVTATTTLGHIAAIPVLVDDGDAVILDHQVHHSVQTAAGLLKGRKVHMEMIRHNNMQMLEEKISILAKKYEKIWYMADGVYSMFGDVCPTDSIEGLLNKYDQFHFYVDDAHGMCCFGKNGSGYIYSKMRQHKRMVLATSLNKAFASGGGAFVFADIAMAKLVRGCGSTLITSGPLQPANLGAGIAASHIHLSNEIYSLQDELKDKIKFTHHLLMNSGLPLISNSGAPIFFVGVSTPKLGYRLVQRMLERGHYVNLGIFPAVPIKNTGIRFTITKLHTYRQINNMIAALKEEFDIALKEEHVSPEQIYKAFRMELPDEKKLAQSTTAVITRSLQLKTHRYLSVLDIEKETWNKMFEGKGAFDWNGLAFLENVFTDNEKQEDNWDFDYRIITDNDGTPVAATFTTTALWKDDMLSPAEISLKIEELRKKDPYHLVSTITSAGSLITEGEHIYINSEHPLWKDALVKLLEEINEIHLQKKSNGVVLRDFAEPREEVISAITDNGYFRTSMPDANIMENFSWKTNDDFFQTLSRKNKMHFRTDIRRYYDRFSFVKQEHINEADIDRWYKLYLQVRERSLDINTFALPEKFFRLAAKNSSWEVNTLILIETGIEMAVVFSYRSGSTYIPTVIGMDYQYLHSHKIYKQSLYRLLERANRLNCEKVQMGFGAAIEKRKLNCTAVSTSSFIQMEDSFNAEFINNYNSIAS